MRCIQAKSTDIMYLSDLKTKIPLSFTIILSGQLTYNSQIHLCASPMDFTQFTNFRTRHFSRLSILSVGTPDCHTESVLPNIRLN